MDPRNSDQALIPVFVCKQEFKIYICKCINVNGKRNSEQNYDLLKWKPVKAMWAKGRRYGMLLVNIDEFAILEIEIIRLIIFSYSPVYWSYHERWKLCNY